MTLTATPLPYGLRDVKVFPLSGEVAGDGVDLPVARTFSFSEAEDFEELRGDDAVVAVRGKGASVNWELESGGVPFEAMKTMFGGTITESGVTPNQTKRWRKNQNDSRPYFKTEGKALSDSGGDFHVVLYRCRCTGELSGEMSDGSFWLTGASGRAIGRESDGLLYDFVQNEFDGIVNVIPDRDEQVTISITGTPTGGSFTLTFETEETGNIAYNAAPTVVRQRLEELASIGVGNVTVVGNPGGPWLVTFVGDLAGEDVGSITATANLTGGTTPAVSVVQTVQGGPQS